MLTNAASSYDMIAVGGVGKRTHSRDSGVDVLTDSGIDNMDSIDSTVASSIDSAADMRAREDEEFSDISESNDGSLANEVNEVRGY